MSQETYVYLSGPLVMILEHGTAIEVLDTQLKVVSQELQNLGMDILAERVYRLRFAEEMPHEELSKEVRDIRRALCRAIAKQ